MKKFLFLLNIYFLISIPVKSENTILERFDYLAQEVERLNFSNGTEASRILQELYKIADKHSDSLRLKTRCLFLDAELKYAQGIYDSTLTYRIQKELSRINPPHSSHSQAILNYSLALTQLVKGLLSDAFTTALHATEQFKKINDSLYISKSMHVLGRVLYHIESFQLAEDYFIQARSYTNPSHKDYYQINSNIYTTGVIIHNPHESIDSLLHLTSTINEDQYPGMISFNYMNIGVIYSILKDYDKAHYYYISAQESCQNIDNEMFSFSLYQNLGNYYINKSDLKEAYKCFLITQKIARHSCNSNLLSTNLLSLSNIHEHFKNIDSAYYYLKEYNVVKNRTVNNANLLEAYQAYISVFMETSKKELIIKEQEILLAKRNYLITTTSALLIILLIISLLIILQQQKRNIRQQAILKDARNKELEERLITKQQIEQLQEDKIAAQVRELTSYSLALSTKNNILQQIAESIERLPEDKTAINEIRKVIKNNLNTNKVWNDFVIHFNKVHPDFFNKIKSFSDDLSENDLRLCAYLCIGMPTKQIAQMLNVSPESIRMHKYRTKKKLGFPEDKNLDDFIRSI